MLRCLGNLLAEETGCEAQIQDERLLVALFVVMQCYLQKHPFIIPECLWLLNNLTGECPCVAVSRARAAAARTYFDCWLQAHYMGNLPAELHRAVAQSEHEGLPGGVLVYTDGNAFRETAETLLNQPGSSLYVCCLLDSVRRIGFEFSKMEWVGGSCLSTDTLCV